MFASRKVLHKSILKHDRVGPLCPTYVEIIDWLALWSGRFFLSFPFWCLVVAICCFTWFNVLPDTEQSQNKQYNTDWSTRKTLGKVWVIRKRNSECASFRSFGILFKFIAMRIDWKLNNEWMLFIRKYLPLTKILQSCEIHYRNI